MGEFTSGVTAGYGIREDEGKGGRFMGVGTLCYD